MGALPVPEAAVLAGGLVAVGAPVDVQHVVQGERADGAADEGADALGAGLVHQLAEGKGGG